MRKYSTQFLTAALLCFLMFSCSKDTTSPECQDMATLEVSNIINTACGASIGSFEVQLKDATNASDAMYSLNGGTAQASSSFTSLSGGSYIVEVKYGDNCVVTQEVVITNEDGLNITLNISGSSCGEADGQIEVIANNATGVVMYQIDGGTPTTDPVFTGLGEGEYQITATDEATCSALAGASIVGEVGFSEIESIISGSCATSGCHNGSVAPNFTNSDNIVSRANRIQSRTGARTMPPGNSPQLTTEEINLIDCWVSGM